MYKLFKIEDKIRVPPKYFSMKLEEAIVELLIEKYERKVDREVGILLDIQEVKVLSEGTVIPGDGGAYFLIEFEVLSYLPEINEVIEANVTEIVEFGAFLNLGPIEGLVHLSQITNDFLTYNRKTSSFAGKESKKSLKKGDSVMAKISTVSLKSNIHDIKVGLTMRPEGLGKEEWVNKEEKKKESEDKKPKPKKVEKKK
ncbi:DNA-directed RNA polymerase [Candidatus Micrarchaeota archaeon]|jgi:DNA-directed RNA polymerase subunit E'|nr:DNA-directed RNA polymerase [Candidatus Micrarchaeota archaeon]